MTLIAALLLRAALLLGQINKASVHCMQLLICPMCLFFSIQEKTGPKRISISTNNNIIYSFAPNGQAGWSESGRNRMIKMKTRGLGLKACEETHIYTYQKVSTMTEALTNQNYLKI